MAEEKPLEFEKKPPLQARSSASVQPPKSEGSGTPSPPSPRPTVSSQPPAPLAPKPSTAISKEDRIIGETVSFEDYVIFQNVEATATDLESLVMLERSIAKGEKRTGESRIMQYVGGLFVGAVILIILLYVMPSVMTGFGI